jgi:large subunit ribosomal protein L5e
LLKQVGLNDLYSGIKEINGKHFDVTKDLESRRNEGEEITKRPFKANLDIGIVTASKGNKVFAAMKGACDGGLYVPHKWRCFPGATNSEKSWKYNADVHRARIYGGHVKDYMDHLLEDDKERYEIQFSQWKKAGSDLEAIYKKLHADIRASPE